MSGFRHVLILIGADKRERGRAECKTAIKPNRRAMMSHLTALIRHQYPVLPGDTLKLEEGVPI